MVAFDVVEDILLRSDANDLLRCKSVCKSWYSLISTPRFVKAHLKKTCNNNDSSKVGHIRIVMPTYWKIANKSMYQVNKWRVVGSSNGLLCASRLLQDGLILLNNPCTGEVRKLPTAPMYPEKVYGVSGFVCLSFGYDASADDYKVVLGIKISDNETLIQVLSLKSDTWKTIGQFKFTFLHNRSGILFNGAFYWFVFERNNKKTKRVIISFDLSREDFTTIPQPSDARYLSARLSLGIADNQLCIYFPAENNDIPQDIWVMKSPGVEPSWERLPNDCEMKYEVVHSLKMLQFSSPEQKSINFFCDDNKCLSKAWNNITAHIFMPSLVSPYVNSGRPSHPTNNKTIANAWSIEVAKGERQHTQTDIGSFFKACEKIEKTYMLEVGEAENLYLHEDGKTEIEEILYKDRGYHLVTLSPENGEGGKIRG